MTTITIDRAVVEQALHVAESAGYPVALIKALRAALAQQAEPVQEPYTSERHFALREAYCIGAADAFWKERPGTKDDGRTIAFDAGFARGFDKGTCLAEQRLAALAQQDEPVAGRAFLERILAAMEGVIDVADRKTDEFDALRSCVIDLTVMLHATPPQRKPLTDVTLWGMWVDSLSDVLRFARTVERAHGIKE